MSFNGFDAGAIGEIDQTTVQTDGVLYPAVQWVYGNQALKKVGGMEYQGGFFIAEDAVPSPDAFEAAGWAKTEWTHQNGESTEGYWKRDLEIAVINLRTRWEVQSDDGKRLAFAWTDFDSAADAGRPVGRLHLLCLIKGLEDEGQFVFTFKGIGGMAVHAQRGSDTILSRFSRTILAAANKKSDEAARKNGRTTGKRWPYRAFWLPVGANRTDKGEPVYIKAGTSADAKNVVLPVAVGLPTKQSDVTDETLGKHYIGNDMLKVINGLWDAAEAEWTHAWDNLAPGTEPTKRNGNMPDAETFAEEGI
ncbi:MAG: hypothetical protein ACOYD4_11760 [Solirubrobacterales bacterium]